MKILTREQLIEGRRVEEVFEFFKQPENLARITPPSLAFQILSPVPIIMRKGCTIDYRIKVMGIPRKWQTLITEYEPPVRFVDVQAKGPYSFWEHTHTFSPKNGGTLITDQVRYDLPLGWAGEIAHALFVKRQLNFIFDYRTHVIRKMF